MRKPVREANVARPFSSQAELVFAGAIFLVALIVYGWTLAPTVTLTDSGELIVAAYGLGVAHPPGISAVGHARTSRVACAGWKRCGANQFLVRRLRCACLCNADSRRGRITRYDFLLCRTSAKEQDCAAGQQH